MFQDMTEKSDRGGPGLRSTSPARSSCNLAASARARPPPRVLLLPATEGPLKERRPLQSLHGRGGSAALAALLVLSLSQTGGLQHLLQLRLGLLAARSLLPQLVPELCEQLHQRSLVALAAGVVLPCLGCGGLRCRLVAALATLARGLQLGARDSVHLHRLSQLLLLLLRGGLGRPAAASSPRHAGLRHRHELLRYHFDGEGGAGPLYAEPHLAHAALAPHQCDLPSERLHHLVGLEAHRELDREKRERAQGRLRAADLGCRRGERVAGDRDTQPPLVGDDAARPLLRRCLGRLERHRRRLVAAVFRDPYRPHRVTLPARDNDPAVPRLASQQAGRLLRHTDDSRVDRLAGPQLAQVTETATVAACGVADPLADCSSGVDLPGVRRLQRHVPRVRSERELHERRRCDGHYVHAWLHQHGVGPHALLRRGTAGRAADTVAPRGRDGRCSGGVCGCRLRRLLRARSGQQSLPLLRLLSGCDLCSSSCRCRLHVCSGLGRRRVCS
eukprot:Rhum_TRINITY_DN13640_c0_g2::Rhum_TRINITY_DN13640_c0_g2_i1::g.62297::m.62297